MSDDTLAELEREARARALCRPPFLLDAAAMIAAASSHTAFLVHDRIPAGEITFFTAQPGQKKSWLAYALALATARGGRWLDLPVLRQGPALIFNLDNSRAECGRRFVRLGLQPEDPVVFHSPEGGEEALRLPAAADDMRAMIAHVRPALVLIDSLRQAHTADENDSGAMMEIMGAFKSFYAGGAAVIVVHHSAKGASGASARGSGEILASATALVKIEGNEATWEKHRSWELAPAQESLYFSVRDDADRTFVTPERAPKAAR